MNGSTTDVRFFLVTVSGSGKFLYFLDSELVNQSLKKIILSLYRGIYYREKLRQRYGVSLNKIFCSP